MTLRQLFLLSVCIFFSGCWFSGQPIPMPAGESGFSKPAQKALVFSAPRKFKWITPNPDSLSKGRVYTFDISKLPFQSFNPAGFNPLIKAPETNAFRYQDLPDTTYNLDAIPSENVKYKISLIGEIKKTTLGQPRLRAESYLTSFQYNDDQGLPGQAVGAILHTRDGLCWINTNRGLCIVNGESVEVFPNPFGESYFMAEDSLGQVWIRTIARGIFIIDRKAGIQKQIENMPLGIHIRIDKNGFIWITTFKEGIYVISPDQKTFKHLTAKNMLATDQAEITFEDKDGRTWIGYDSSGIDILDPALKKIKQLRPGQNLSNNTVFTLAENANGDIYIGGNRNGIDIFNTRNQTHKHLDSAQGIRKRPIYYLLEDDDGNMWASNDNLGIYVINPKVDSLRFIDTHLGLGEGFIFCLAKDKKHQVLVGTSAGGLNVFPQAGEIGHHLSVKEGLVDDNVWTFMQDSRNRFWIGTHNGVNIITPDQKIYKLKFSPGSDRDDKTDGFLQTGPDQFILCGSGAGLIFIDESRHTLEKFGSKEGFPEMRLRKLYRDKSGLIWIASSDNGILLLDPVKRTFRLLNQSAGLSSDNITSIQSYGPGKYLISTYGGGMDLLNTTDSTLVTYSTKEGLSNDLTLAILKDVSGRIWIPTERGLNLLDTTEKTNTVFSASNGMSANAIYTLFEKQGKVYAGTSKGLTVFNETVKKTSASKESVWDLQTFGKSLGFGTLDFNSNAFGQNPAGQYWWGIAPGITVLDTAVFNTVSVKPVQVSGIDILGKSQNFIDPTLTNNVDTIWSEVKDSFYLKGSFGELNADKKRGIEWSSLSANYMPVDLSLPPGLNYLRFHFGEYLPQNEGIYTYQYILDGVDEKWSKITDQPQSENYNNISPGYYTFRVSVRKEFGPWSEPAVYKFRIRPHWWQSWWAELIYFLIFVGLVRLWVRYRSRRLTKENIMLEQKVAERTAALSTSLENLRQTQGQLIQAEKMASLGELTAGIAHEIQNPLNFVNNFSEVNTELVDEVNKALEKGDVSEAKDLLKDVEMNMEKITFHGKRADTIVKGMLLHSRASSGQKIPTNVNVLADEYLRLSYHGLRAKDKSFNAQFSMDLDEKIEDVLLVQQDIGRVLLNLFNNAFYSVTEKKKTAAANYEPAVSVSTKKKKDTIEIRIRDNGQGISKKVLDKIYQPFFTTKPAGQGTGLGLSLSYDIITKEHNGKIDVVTKENEFTEFILELPL